MKLGLEFCGANGPEGVSAVVSTGLPVFLDLKLHDMPNTVAGAIKALMPLGAAVINVHASGGAAMMRAAAEAARTSELRAKVIAVTVLTASRIAASSKSVLPAPRSSRPSGWQFSLRSPDSMGCSKTGD